MTTGMVLGTALGATAADEPLTIDDLPSVDRATIDAQRTAIDIPDIDGIDIPDIEAFEPEVSASGGDTIVRLDTDVLFEFGEADLGAQAEDAVVDAITDVPDGGEVTVEGYTDSVGSAADNLALSKKRAQAVADVLGQERDDLDLTVTGRGEKDPIEPNESGGEDNPEGREANRRVEIRYVD